MKKLNKIILLALVLLSTSLNALTFDFTTAPVGDTSAISTYERTIDTVKATVTTDTGKTFVHYYGIEVGNVGRSTADNTFLEISFDKAIDITTLEVDFKTYNNSDGNKIFMTPIGGSNSVVTIDYNLNTFLSYMNDTSGMDMDAPLSLNWTGVTGFRITTNGSAITQTKINTFEFTLPPPVSINTQVHHTKNYNHVLNLENSIDENVTWALKSGTTLPSWLTFKDSYEVSTLVETTNIADPASLAVDKYGNIYVVGRSDGNVSKITPNGDLILISTITGGGQIRGITIDSTSNIYALDQSNNKIIKITPDGTQSEFATGFNSPYQMAIDSNDNIFVADRVNNKVVKITPTGTKSDFATGLTSVKGIAIDKYDNIFTVNDSDNRDVNKITPNGVITKVGEFGSDKSIYSIGVDDEENVYIPWFHQNKVMKVSKLGILSEVSADDFGGAYGAAYDRVNHRLIISTNTIDKIKTIDLPYKLVGTPTYEDIGKYQINFSLSNGQEYIYNIEVYNTAPTFGTNPLSTINKNNEYKYEFQTSDDDNDILQLTSTLPSWLKLSEEKTISTLYSTNDSVAIGAIVKDKDGNIYFTDKLSIKKIPVNGGEIVTIANGFTYLRSLAINSNNIIFAIDAIDDIVYSVTLDGVVRSFASVNTPYDIAIDSSNNLYVAQASTNDSVAKITPNGTVTTISSDYFDTAQGVAIDSNDNLYVTNKSGHITKVTPSNQKSTFADFSNLANVAIYNMTIDANDNIYIPDYGNKSVYKVTSSGEKSTLIQNDGTLTNSYGVYFDAAKRKLYVSQWSAGLISEFQYYDVLSGTPDSSNVGEHNVTLSVSDGVDTTQQTFKITVTDPAPEITSDERTSVYEGDTYSYTLKASDIDNDNLTWTVKDGTTIPDWLTLDSTSAWEVLGIAGFSDGNTSYNSIALDSFNTPYVVYKDYANGSKATVKKYNGTSWETVGESGFSTGKPYEPSIALDNFNIPYVVYADGSNYYHATVMKYNGTSWEVVGNEGFSTDGVAYTTIKFDSNNTPYVVYKDKLNGNKATVMKYDGTSWVLVGNAGFSAGKVAYTSITFDSNNTPYVVYNNYLSDSKSTVMKYDGTSWVLVGNAGFSAGEVSYTSIVIDSNDTPYVVYIDKENSSKATVMKYDGTSWVSVGNAGFSAGEVEHISISIDSNNTPYVAYRDSANSNKATVMKYNGTSWVLVGNVGFSVGETYFTSIAIDSNGTPYVVYTDVGNDGKATVMKFKNSSILSGTPTSSDVGEYPISLILSDGVNEVEHNFTITVSYVNHTPTDITLTGSLDENAEIGTTIGTLNTVDGDNAWDSYTYSFCESEGYITIEGNTLKSNKIFDYEDENSYQTCIKTVDSKGETFEKNITISINNLNDNKPSVKSDAKTSINEEATYSYTLKASDIDNDNLTWKVKDGTTLPDWLSLEIKQGWESLGGTGFTNARVSLVSLAINQFDVPYISFSDGEYNSKATVMRYNGSSWEYVGTPGLSKGFAVTKIKFNSQGIPYLYYKDYGNSQKVTVMKFQDNNWEYVGINGFSDGEVNDLSLDFDSNNNPYVIFRDSTANGKATVMKYNGNAWEAIGDKGFTDNTSFYTVIAINNFDVPYIAFYDDAYSGKATVMKYSNSMWETVGSPGFTDQSAYDLSIEISSDGYPYIAYHGEGDAAVVMKYDGNTWSKIGSITNDSADNTDFILDNNNIPLIAFKDGGSNSKATVMKYSDNSWNVIGLPGFSENYISTLSLTIDSNNEPYLGYSDSAYDEKATVMKYIDTISLIGTPTSSDVGQYPISLILSDGVNEVEHNFTITVNNVNNKPTITSTPIKVVDEDSLYSYSLSASDLDNDPLTWSVKSGTTLPTWLKLSGSTLSGTPTNDDVGEYSIELTLSDGTVSVVHEFMLTVKNINDAPTSANFSVNLNEDSGYEFTKSQFKFTDVDNEGMSKIKIITLPSKGVLKSGNTPISANDEINAVDISNIVYEPVSNEFGNSYASFTYKISDGIDYSVDSYTVTLNVASQNDAPTISNTTDETKAEDFAQFTKNFTIADVDGDDLNISIENSNSDLLTASLDLTNPISKTTYNTNPAVLTVNSIANKFGKAKITLTVKDGVSSKSTSFNIEVPAVLDFPSISDEKVDVSEDFDTYDVKLTGIDLAGQSSATIDISIANETIIGLVSNSISTSTNEATFTLKSLENKFGNTTATIKVTAGTQVVQKTIDISVKAVNDASTITNTLSNAVENSAYSWTPTVVDVDNTSHTFKAIGLPTWASINETTGAITGTPSYEDARTNKIKVIVSDGDLSSEYDFDLVVQNTNRIPTKIELSNNKLNENDTNLFGTFKVTDSDANDNHTFGFCGGADDASFTISENQIKASSALDYETKNSYSICVRVNDGTDDFDTNFTISLNDLNDSIPTSQDFSVTVDEDTNKTFTSTLFKFTDADTNAVFETLKITSVPAKGSLKLNGVDVSVNQEISSSSIGSLVFTPTENENRSSYATFKYKVNDGVNESIEYTTTINVTAIDDAPVIDFINDVFTNEDTSVEVSFSASDVENDAISYAVSSSNTSIATVSIVNSKIVVVPVENVSGDVEITLQATANSKTAEQKFRVIISSVNDLPTSSDFTIETYEDSTYNFNEKEFAFTDIDNIQLNSIQIITLPAKGLLKLDGEEVSENDEIDILNIKKLTYTPILNENGSSYATFKYKVNDGTDYSTDANTVTIDVTAVNDTPTISSTQDEIKAEDFGEFTKEFILNDVDGDDLNVSVINSNTDLLTTSIDLTNPIVSATYINENTPLVLTLTSIANKYGKSKLTMKVSDANSSSTTSFVVEVPAVLDFPSISTEKIDLNEDFEIYNIKLTGIDLAGESDALIEITIGDTNITDVISNSITTSSTEAIFTLKSVENATGDTTATIKVTAGTQVVEKTIDILVKAVNDAPVITNTPKTGIESIAYSWTPSVEDVDNSASDFSFSIERLPLWASFNSSTGEISGTPSLSDAKNYENIELTVSDGELTHKILTNILIENKNQAPLIKSDNTIEVKENNQLIGYIDAIDLDEDTMSFSISGGDDSSNFKIDSKTGELTFVSSPNFEKPIDLDENNIYLVDIDVSDGTLSSTLNLTVKVLNINENPSDINLSISSFNENDSNATTQLSAVDVDIDDIHTFEFCGGTDDNSFKITEDKLIPLSTLDYETKNSYSICLRTKDLKGVSYEKTIVLSVTNLNEKPVIEGTPNTSINEDLYYSFKPNVSDDDTNDSLIFSISNKPSWANFDTLTGELSGTPTNDNIGITKDIVISVSDGTEIVLLNKFDLTVIGVDDAPVFDKIKDIDANEDFESLSIPLNGKDEEGDAISYKVTSSNTSIANVKIINGKLVVTPVGNASGLVSITVDAISNGKTTSQTFTLDVKSVNDKPVLVDEKNNAIEKLADKIVYKNFKDVNISLNSFDAENSNISYEIKTLTDNIVDFSFDETTKTLTVKAKENIAGKTDIELKISDGELSNTYSFNFYVIPLEDGTDLEKVEDVSYDYTSESTITTVNISNDLKVVQKDNIDGTVEHEIDVAGKIIKASSTIIGSVVQLIENGVKTVFEDTIKNLSLEVSASLTGEAKHSLTKNGKTTQAISQNENASTVISEDSEGKVQIVTSVDVNGTTLLVTAKEDGSAIHEVNKAGKTSKAISKIVGAQILITQAGEVKTSAGEVDDNNGYYVKALVITNSDGQTKTKFVKVSKTDESDITVVSNTLKETLSFEIGSDVEISDVGGTLYIKTLAPLGDTPLVIE